MVFRFASAAALAAAASMITAPLGAAELPRIGAAGGFAQPSVLGTNAVNANDHRRWHHRDRVDAGDVVAGVAVVGVLAALASAVGKQSKRDRARTRGYPYPDRPYDYRAPTDSRYDDSRGIDRAVDTCVREVERNGAIDTVDTVERTGTGWHVSGQLRGGAAFSCSIGSDGQIEGVDNGRVGAAEDQQWNDDRYAAARQSEDGGAAPAYPGGPVDGDADDDRYETAQTPDVQG